ncbi:MAG: PIN domain-containing protein, partial [Thermoanaerobaculia bacterium]|nr:PIN domain-containing protein [Thermoanaerobaculia bacterium]
MPAFVDTNVFVYRFDASDPAKSARSEAWLRELWQSGEGRLSVQVLQELYVTLTRKVSQPMPAVDARLVVGALVSWDPVVLDRSALEGAWALEDRYSLSWRDALIVAAAQIAGCAYLLTEDLGHDQVFDGVRIVDPFRL